jgi:hypothetical protein
MRITHPPRCGQEIVLLGNQKLTDLRDKILCPSDLVVSRDLSENPDEDFTQRKMVNIYFYSIFNSKYLGCVSRNEDGEKVQIINKVVNNYLDDKMVTCIYRLYSSWL